MTWDFLYNLCRRLASAARPRGACRLPRAGRPTQFHADPARLRIGRADALRLLVGVTIVTDRRFRLRLRSQRCAACRLAARRSLRDLREPARADAGQRRRQAGRLLLRHVVQPLRLEPAQHPGADPCSCRRTMRNAGDGLDAANAGLLLVALFYLKITYFAGGLALVGLALLISPHVRARLPAWVAIGGPDRRQCRGALEPSLPARRILTRGRGRRSAQPARASTSTTSSPTPKATQPYAAGARWSPSGCGARGLAPPRVPLAVAGILAVGALRAVAEPSIARLAGRHRHRFPAVR